MNETPIETAQVAPNSAKLQAVVDYLPGITIAGAESALLEWSADDRIKFFKMDFDRNQATEVLFDVPVQEVTNVAGTTAMLTLTVGGKKYNAQFNRTAAGMVGIGGVAGLALAAQSAKTTGAQAWINAFKDRGTPMKGYYSYGKIFAIALIVVGVLVVGVVVAVMIGAIS